MDPLQARLGNQVSHTLPISPLPVPYRAGVPYFLALFLAGFGYFSLLMAWERAFSAGATILGGTCLLLAVLSGVSLHRHRTWRWALTLYEHGIALQRGGRTRTFLFEEIRELAIHEREQFNEATRYGVLREVTVRSARDRLTFRVLSQDNLRDTAGTFLETVRACLAEVAGRRLRAGEPLAGQGWTLTGGALQAAGQTTPLDMLSEAELYGDRVAVWKSGEEMPYFSVPAHSTNALVLLDVLASRLPEHAHRHHGLGRALFERRTRRELLAAGGIMALLTLACAAGFVSLGAMRPVLGAANAATGVALGLVTLLSAVSGFRVHQGGIVKLSAFGRRQLLFADVERMSCLATRHYHNGVYTGTSFELRFQPAQGRPFKIRTRVRGSSLHDLELLRDRVAGLLADRLRERLDRESEVPWTDGVWLSHQGVRFARRRLIGRGEATTAAFSQSLRYSIDQGTFQLFAPREPKSVLGIPCAAENFYPGFVLFGRLAAGAATPRTGAARG